MKTKFLRHLSYLTLALTAALAGCGAGEEFTNSNVAVAAGGTASGEGGAGEDGGAGPVASGGRAGVGTGGIKEDGGSGPIGTGGDESTGGVTSTGGKSGASGGTVSATGGSSASTGGIPAGGAATGGTTSTGGTQASGGTSGGTASTGGKMSTGGSGGAGVCIPLSVEEACKAAETECGAVTDGCGQKPVGYTCDQFLPQGKCGPFQACVSGKCSGCVRDDATSCPLVGAKAQFAYHCPGLGESPPSYQGDTGAAYCTALGSISNPAGEDKFCCAVNANHFVVTYDPNGCHSYDTTDKHPYVYSVPGKPATDSPDASRCIAKLRAGSPVGMKATEYCCDAADIE